MTRILTPDEYIIRTVNAYPGLYAAPSYDNVKFKILDHVFNVIGNGLTLNDFMGEPVTEAEKEVANRWFSCKRAANGYMKTRVIDGTDIVIPAEDPLIIVPVNEIEHHPEIVHWVEFDCFSKEFPYSNLNKKYSLVWSKEYIDFSTLGVEWNKAASWYYSKCLEYFMDDKSAKTYHAAFPTDSARDNSERIDALKRRISVEKYPTIEDISRAYECEFVGDRDNDSDVADFLAKRWYNKRNRIIEFIQETLEMLK